MRNEETEKNKTVTLKKKMKKKMTKLLKSSTSYELDLYTNSNKKENEESNIFKFNPLEKDSQNQTCNFG